MDKVQSLISRLMRLWTSTDRAVRDGEGEPCETKTESGELCERDSRA
ncbi:uncharacterized protein G2W53_032688 [Senna tora]|uniref:Uncharacterized protein n=1 Tax=Senna tora TaxID=362788 RepID=A0A834T0W7_9FABA|nr:uncharacterized protein G2W53_032688 [Senna tora]